MMTRTCSRNWRRTWSKLKPPTLETALPHGSAVKPGFDLRKTFPSVMKRAPLQPTPINLLERGELGAAVCEVTASMKPFEEFAFLVLALSCWQQVPSLGKVWSRCLHAAPAFGHSLL